MEYFITKLNSREFESLSCDIISKFLNTPLEKFKAGKDGGVDGRFWIGNAEGILQCKHFWKTGYKGLISHLKNQEIQKVNKLKPLRYILVTSVPLSRANKNEIKTIFFPYVQQETDIWGEDDLNSFLSDNRNLDIVEKNYKLWITSAKVLDILFNNTIKGRSESTLRFLESQAEKYIITRNHEKGLKILQDNNVLIISGEPGIGKTTLANSLASYYSANGFEFCDIEESISEAENIFREKEKKKILFYCDDFLGSNMYDAISNKRDSHIVKFINRVKSDNTKKFILTSRTTILNKAISLSHQFQNSRIQENELLLKIENLSEIDKANILYNHIYHSNLDEVYIEQLYIDKKYKEIIKHRNFNPRIIEFITDSSKVAGIKPENYWLFIKNKLNNPEDIWSEFFQNQVDDSVRVLVYLIVFNGQEIQETELNTAYTNYKNNHGIISSDNTDRSFLAVRKLATKSLINRTQYSDKSYTYTLFNPSIGDFVLNTYLEDVDLVISTLKSLGTTSSVVFINRLRFNNKLNKSAIEIIQFQLFSYYYEPKVRDRDWDYLIALSFLDPTNSRSAPFMESFVANLIVDTEASGKKLYELLIVLDNFRHRLIDNDFSFLSGFIKESMLDEYEIQKILEFITDYNIENESLIRLIEESVEEYLIDSLHDQSSSIEISKHLSYGNDEFGYNYDVDYDAIKLALTSLLDSIAGNFNVPYLKSIRIDESEIISSVDIDSLVERYLSSHNDIEDDFRGSSGSGSNLDSDIDAIFERS